jgi:hypothetical protein
MIPGSAFKRGSQESPGPFIPWMIERAIRRSLLKEFSLIEETEMIHKTCLLLPPLFIIFDLTDSFSFC